MDSTNNTTDTVMLSPPRDDVEPSSETATKPGASALTPPTSEEMNNEQRMKNESAESDLSDLDLDDESDGEEIEPDHYYEGGRIPVFKPTMDQFRSFKKFVNKIDKYGMKAGIVKVVPPQEWRENLPALDEYVKKIKIKNPITQEFNGAYGTYTQQNVEKQRSYNLPEWKDLTEKTDHQPPAKRGERRRNQEKVVRGGGKLRGRAAAGSAASQDGEEASKPKRKPGRPKRGAPTTATEQDEEKLAEEADPPKARRSGRAQQAPPTPASPAPKPAKAAPKPKGRQPKGGQAKTVTSRRLNNTSEAADYVDEAAFEDFDYHMDGLDEFTAERCAELESHYWRSLAFNQPMYAADMPGSLFDDTVTSWNVAKLENLLDVLGTKVPGVNTAYLYMGMWKATFAWHLEDVDLYSINYIHFGAPKQWYSISQEDARKFEAAMKSVWPQDAKNCDQFLRHKTYLISPDVLQKQYNVKVNKLVHYEGEFVITFPYGYHSGYNLGYNCAESVNFATDSWLEYGRIAKKCNCEADNVWVDVADIERRLRGEPTPEYYEETDDEDEEDQEDDGNLPSPPASVKGSKAQSKKRKREPKQEAPKKKKKIRRIRIKGPTREPCIMCPNDNSWDPLLPADNGRKAHRSCALYTPETWISNDQNKPKVHGVTNVDRARLELRCNFCRSKRGGSKLQCAAKKCTRSYHASCALAAGVLIDCGPVPTFGEDGTEYFEDGYDFRCRYHRPKMAKNFSIESVENSKRISNFAKQVQPGDVVQAQQFGGEVYAGVVVENRPSELTVLVDVIPEGNRVEVDWKWLCVLDPDDSQRPKPSSKAVAMPEGLNKNLLSMDNRQDGVPTMEQDFHDNPDFKWAEFANVETPPKDYRLNPYYPQKFSVRINDPDQLYYYLGKISTDAKCFFTDTPNGTVHVPRSNFMERVAPRPAFQHPPQRQALAAVHPAQTSRPPKPLVSAATNVPAISHNFGKPYAYKPKAPVPPQPSVWSVDQQALANQRSFTTQGAQAGRRPSGTQQTPQQSSTSSSQAAWPGEYSQYREVVRRQSQGQQSMQQRRSSIPHNQQTPEQQMEAIRRNSQVIQQYGAPQVPGMMGHVGGGNGSMMAPALPQSGSQAGNGIRPSSSSQSHHSPVGAPPTPATTSSVGSKPTDQDRRNSQEWRPTHTPTASYPTAQYQTPSEFQQQLARQPSMSAQNSNQQRLLHELGQQNYRPNSFHNSFQHNNFSQQPPSQPYESAPMWNNSPKAPTPSPLSDPHVTPNNMIKQGSPLHHSSAWQTLPSMGNAPTMNPAASMNASGQANPYGPMLPQMGGETWRYP
ncbi:hypothetical protein MBLNU230_g6451t1 [Neophaeotheca triangularis]